MTENEIAKLATVQQSFLEQLLKLAGLVTELQASVNVLKLHAISQMFPGDPLEGLKQFRVLEQKLLDSDPNEKGRKEAAQVIEAVKLWKKHGGPHES